MKKFLLLVFLMIPALLAGQDTNNSEQESDIVVVPILAQYSDRFKISPIYFNKKMDIAGRGDILEIEMIFENLTDDPIEFKLFTVGIYGMQKKSDTSFEMPSDTTKTTSGYTPAYRPFISSTFIQTLAAWPDDADNFIYSLKDQDGNNIKDYFGKEKTEYRIVPKDTSKGMDVKLEPTERTVIRTSLLCKYKKRNYNFFNESAILIYGSEGKPIFYQQYKLYKTRR